ncbi:hypothetical protein H1P_1650007 [Hyella patelloides LEGE 07179]|uniref:Uncharacterized protein n=1 Tax=Hyella patelloides LEGE 07179 TaxID=945734 RepID=A0A563VND1_9CYAN|nr:hypothetical protein H1P_1650007 [Hyella patelloides LEGE 07179]
MNEKDYLQNCDLFDRERDLGLVLKDTPSDKSISNSGVE